MPLPKTWQFDAIGTRWKITTKRELTAFEKENVSSIIELFDTSYSRFRSDSLMSKFSSSSTSVRFEESMRLPGLFDFYLDMYKATNGAVTPLVGKVLADAGYDASYTLKNTIHPSRLPSFDRVMERHGHKLTLREPVILDVGAAGKGLLVDIIASKLQELGVHEFVVDASGDIVHHARDAYRVGLEHPGDATKVIGTIELSNESLCSSASNRRSWGDDVHHVIDGRTGMPTRDIVATWVLSASGMVSDGLATALFFLDDPDEYLSSHSAAYLRISRAGTIEMNTAMKERVTLFV